MLARRGVRSGGVRSSTAQVSIGRAGTIPASSAGLTSRCWKRLAAIRAVPGRWAVGNRGLVFPAEPLSGVEVRQLLAAIDCTRVTGIRNHALLVVLWRAGLRCSEALALRPSDIDFDAGTLRVLRGKGRKARTVGLDDSALAVLSVWLESRPLGPGPLFCVLTGPGAGGAMSPRYVRAYMARLAARAGIGHRVHPHGLRHTMACELSREGWPLALISRQLGHSNVATTDTYLRGLYPAEAVERARGRSWAS
jgi:integrase/recombinase XerD